MMVESIAKTLGAGSGIDVTALVSSLVEAQYQTKEASFTKRDETLTAQVSAISQLKSGITGFASALSSLVKGGTLATQPTSSNTGIVKVSTLAGSKVGTLSSSVEVRALASAQVTASATPVAAGTQLGTGSFKIQFGAYDESGSFVADATDIPAIDITDAADSTLAAIAAKINATPAAGLTASVITDGGGERLVLKSATGAARAFTITATGGSSFVDTLGVAANDSKIAASAADAKVAVDGVEVSRSSNSISDLIPGVTLELQTAAVGTRVAIGSTPATDALKQAVNDVVTTFNELYAVLNTATDPKTGPLARDPGALEMVRTLRRLTLTDLTGATDGTPKTLAEIGVATNRDGTLSVNGDVLTSALSRYPAAIETMFADGAGASGNGLSAALNSMSLSITSTLSGIGASALRYSRAQTVLAEDKEKVTTAQDKLRERLTQQYSAMDAKVAAYKTTQTFLTQQIEAWNAS